MHKITAIAIGGAIGALFRYGTSGLIHRFFDGVFPSGTLTVNMTGSLLIGLIWGLSESIIISPNARLFIFIGILGSFTTFSSYSLESLNLLKSGELKLAAANILANNIMGILLVFAGLAISKQIIALYK